MKKLLLIVGIFISLFATAQIRDTSTFRFRINADIIPNNNGTITATKLNTLLNGVLNSFGPLFGGKVDSVWSSEDQLHVRKNGVSYTYTLTAGIPYITFHDSLNTKLNISDTASMLYAYRIKSMLQDGIISALVADSSYQAGQIATKLNISDTTALLSPYLKSINAATTYKAISDSNYANGYTTRARLKQYGDSLSATIPTEYWSRTGTNLSPINSGDQLTVSSGTSFTQVYPTGIQTGILSGKTTSLSSDNFQWYDGSVSKHS